MGQESLLEKLDEAASKARLLEHENSETIAKIQTFEREIGALKELISLAESKADEMLMDSSAPDTHDGPATLKAHMTIPSLAPEELQDLKQRFPHAFTPD
jgi:hypothetical protein